MLITQVRAAGLSGATPKGGWSTELKPEDDVHTLIAIHTDEGLVGVGSVFTSHALVAASLQLLERWIVGREVTSPRRLTEELHQATFWQGRGGAVTHTISGINIALWDIYGQMVGRPIWELLGGPHRMKVTPYASLLMDAGTDMERSIEHHRGLGFRAFKIGWGPFGRVDHRTDAELVARARHAAGDDAVLAVDAGGSDAHWPHGYAWALNAARMLADFDIAWFEEALSPDDTSGFALLREHSPVPISGGEVLTRRQSFTPLIDAGCFDIVQPDVTKVGGLDESYAIGRYAEDRAVKLVPHGWNTAIGLAADLHLAAALAHTDLVEYCVGSAYIDDIVAEPWTLDGDGFLTIPDGPGLGVRLDPARVAALTHGNDLGLLPDGPT